MLMRAIVIFTAGMLGGLMADPEPRKVDYFSDWKKVPEFFADLENDSLHRYTLIKLGEHQISRSLSEEEHEKHLDRVKKRWADWWESTGKEVAAARLRDAKVDREAFDLAWKFLETDNLRPESIDPVWVPKEYALYLVFTNGDYGGREKEVWVLERRQNEASLSKLRGAYAGGKAQNYGWKVNLSYYEGMTPQYADRVLRALSYAHHYAPNYGPEGAGGIAGQVTVPDEKGMGGLYYPGVEMHLRDGKNRIIWNTNGYEFLKCHPQHLDGEAGMSYFFLRTVFPDKAKWKEVSEPTSKQVQSYVQLLANSQPYFFSCSEEVVKLLARVGGEAEKEALRAWEKQLEQVSQAGMHWTSLCGDFSTCARENLISRSQLELKELRKLLEEK